MPTICKEQFQNNSEVSLDMCEEKYYVFSWVEGKYQGVNEYPKDSYHLPIALAAFQDKVTEILTMLADKIKL